MTLARFARTATMVGRSVPQYTARRSYSAGPISRESLTTFGPEAFEPIPKEGFFLAGAATTCIVISWGIIYKTKSHVSHPAEH